MLKHLLKHDTFKYLAASVLMVVALYPKFPLIEVPETFVSIRFEDLLLFLVTCVLVLQFLYKRHFPINFKIPRLMILYLAIGLTSLASAIFITKTVTPHLSILHWVRRVEYFIPFFLGLVAIRSKSDLGFIIKTAMLVILIVFIYGWGQRYLDWPIIATQNQEYSKGVALRYREGGHINSTFAGHYDLSSFLVLILPIFVAYLFGGIKNMSKLAIAVFSVTIFSGLWLIAVSGSRISSVSFIIAASVSLVLIKKAKLIPLIVVISLLVFSFSPSLKARYTRLFEVTKEKIENVIGVGYIKEAYALEDTSGLPQIRFNEEPTPTPLPVFEDRSTSIRLNVEWPRAIRSFLKNPMLGTGYSSITLATDNDYLRLLGELGLLGFASFIIILAQLINLMLESIPFSKFKPIESYFLAGITGGFIGILINALFIDLFEASKFSIIFWLLTGMLVNTAKHYKYE